MSDNVDYGPLKGLIGRWEGDRGTDIAPEPDGTETNKYREHLEFEPIGDLDNAQTQFLSILCYRQRVFRIRDGKRIHDQVGYWMWDADNETVLHSYTIPRGVNVTAAGCVVKNNNLEESDGVITLSVNADSTDEVLSISESRFMAENASTKSFKMTLNILGEHEISYQQETVVDIYGKSFVHTDENLLRRVT